MTGMMVGASSTSGVDAAQGAIRMDPVSLILGASGPVFAVVWMLIFASVLVWFIAVLKLLQLRRWSRAEHRFEESTQEVLESEKLFKLAQQHPDAPGADVVRALEKRKAAPDLLPAIAKRAVVKQEQRASTLMPTLASIGAASPFIGLFGTVYGIMDAFLRIGREKSASLPVVAPAIGEALIATAIGLFAAIPAVIAYNALSKRSDDLLSRVEASAEAWVALISNRGTTGGESLAAPLDNENTPVKMKRPSHQAAQS